MYDKFIDFCTIGNLNGLINHINMNTINIHANNEEGFIRACRYGHKHIVEYLINIHKTRQSRNPNYVKINIHANNELGFRWACYYEHTHIIKYLINLYKNNPTYAKINIHIDNYGFKITCICRDKHIIKYLSSCGCYSDNYKCIIL